MLGEAKPLISGLGYAQRSESGDGVFVKAAVRGMPPPHQLGGLASAASLLGGIACWGACPPPPLNPSMHRPPLYGLAVVAHFATVGTDWQTDGRTRHRFNRLRLVHTAKKTTEWVLNKSGVKKELLDAVKARKLAYYGHTTRKQGSCLEKEIMQGTMPGARRRGRPRTAWMDNIKT